MSLFNRSSRFQVIAVLIICLLNLCGLGFNCSVAFAESSAERLFLDIPNLSELNIMDVQKGFDETTIRSRVVWVDIGNLENSHQPQGADLISLNLFADVEFVASKKRLERRSPTKYTWFGSVLDREYSHVILVVNDGNMVGSIAVDEVVYQVRVTRDGLHVIREIDQSGFPECQTEEAGYSSEATHIPRGVRNHADQNALDEVHDDDGSLIDVLVAYTQDVSNASGNIAAEIQLAIDETNTSYSNSGINQRVRLVHSVQVAYDETGNLLTDRNRLKDPGDNFPELDALHSMRDTYQADIVSLWVESGGGCGIAYIMETVSTDFEEKGFCVVRRDCATGNYTFGHELGHIMSARHDWYVDDTNNTPYSYNHGYADTGNRWRTVMAYNRECEDSGFSCTRLLHWSNPDIDYQGDPTGIPEGLTDRSRQS